MTNEIISNTNEINKENAYSKFIENLKIFFEKSIEGDKQLFNTNVENLYDVFLSNIPKEDQQYYNCGACRKFVNRFGGLVTIDEDGIMSSVMWSVEHVPELFIPAVEATKVAVLKARVKGVFIYDKQELGVPVTGEWSHLSVSLPESRVNPSLIRTVYQRVAMKREDFKVLSRVSSVHTKETIDQATELLKSETIYRGDRYIPAAEWFKQVLMKRESLTNIVNRENYLWLATAKAPVGFVPSNGSNLGNFFCDIGKGMPLEYAAARLTERMNSETFMRAQAAPTANKISEDERIFKKFVEAGIATKGSLYRRYATYEEIPKFLWQDKAQNKSDDRVQEAENDNVFGHLTPKSKSSDKAAIPSAVMTWEKFERTVLPTAEKIEALVDNPNRFVALVTAADKSAPNILQWDNTFSWYYHAGVDAEIKRRVVEAGGRYENNEMRLSLSWENYTDLDIHCITPSEEHIFYGEKTSSCGGWLDVDANGGGANTMTPVENIRWADNVPNGRYRFYVHNYCERGSGKTPFKVEMEVRGKTWTYNGVSGSTGWQVDVFEFDYNCGEVVQIRHAAITSDDSWTAEASSFIKVKGITKSPNLWGDRQVLHAGNHTFFLLDGVRDTSEGLSRGFFNEHLRSELHEIRRTLEAFATNATIQGADNANACGLGYSKENEWNLVLKVASNNSTRIVKIDRWD
ncbi:hypothetical protein CONCODRAFT_14381 [Conidiobolus coronatus NRRL 28638]|uniref:Uncharacterized protein n=1 Tax=Conidiobolus coronatus (strain ATCC 28846 / CBS 209.66 / NRRL 28638) TaxID=796925 RepID=A0A137PJ92_CONC2|nr:hypothetical protein CONCODRAFT_14381 [Conidiobolus coronatus NRRL 28638]|eukprot:KXN75045.1 hypothetical protein CONCODRAFT_14381 [Conidiobolus coronatus NRRL 28638]